MIRKQGPRRWAGPSAASDLTAGLTVGAVVVPQSLAYADLAGVAPVAGMYAALAALVAYAALGSSPIISLGPTATSAILAAAVGQTVGGGTHATAVAATALLAGLLALAAGLARLGFLANLLSRPVLLGYSAGAAVTIAVSQAGPLLGVPVRGREVTDVVAELPGVVGDVSWTTVAVAAGSLVALVMLPRLGSRLPAPLVVVVGATAAVWLLDLAAHGVATVGDLPGGLPGAGLPDLGRPQLADLLLPASAVALVGFAETVGQARVLAPPHQQVDPNRELVAVGAANAASGLVGGVPVSSSFSRNALSVQAGARTRRTSLIAAAVVLVTLLAATDTLSRLPVASLAAIIVVSVSRLVPVRAFRRLAHLQRDDAAVALAAFAGVVLIGILPGLALAVALSVGGLLYRVTNYESAVLGYVPEQDTWRQLDHHPTALTLPGVLVVRFSGPLYFANATRLRHEVAALVADAPAGLRRVVVEGRTISYLDATAVEMLAGLHDLLAAEGIELVFAGLRRPALDTFLRSELVHHVGEEALVYPTVRAATGRAGGDP